jgi:hypothetical protein
MNLSYFYTFFPFRRLARFYKIYNLTNQACGRIDKNTSFFGLNRALRWIFRSAMSKSLKTEEGIRPSQHRLKPDREKQDIEHDRDLQTCAATVRR